MADLPNPLRLLPGTPDVTDAVPEGGRVGEVRSQLLVGGRHGSPSIVIGMPFSKVTHTETDPALRGAVAALAELTARLADLVGALADSDHEGTDLDPATLGAAAGALADEARDLLDALEAGED
jgi:hypothetical protein